MTPVHLALLFVASNPHFFRVHDHDVVPGVYVRCEFWLVFSAQTTGYLGSYSTKRFALRIDNPPRPDDVLLPHTYRFHLLPLLCLRSCPLNAFSVSRPLSRVIRR